MHVHSATREFDFGSLGIFLTPISADTVASLGMVLGIMKRPSKQSAVFKIEVCVCTFWCSKQDH